jgi:hypothetical protein
MIKKQKNTEHIHENEKKQTDDKETEAERRDTMSIIETNKL